MSMSDPRGPYDHPGDPLPDDRSSSAGWAIGAIIVIVLRRRGHRTFAGSVRAVVSVAAHGAARGTAGNAYALAQPLIARVLHSSL